jgi:uncharacterized protein (TIGR02588 family)
MNTAREQRPARTSAEWVTFVVACLILLGVVALVSIQLPDGDNPPLPVTEVGQVRRAGDQFVVPVVVRNDGDLTAENVQVIASLTIDEETVEGDQTVDFLAGEATHDLEFVFAEDPAGGELEVRVAGYSRP